MLNFGYLKEKEYYIEKSFNLTKRIENKPSNSIYLTKKEQIEKLVHNHIENETVLNSFYIRLNSSIYDLIITDKSFLLLENFMYNNKAEMIDEDQIKILKYYIEIMTGKIEVNCTYFKIYQAINEQNNGIKKKLLKKTK